MIESIREIGEWQIEKSGKKSWIRTLIFGLKT
jgi:hypothetical protein